MNDDKYGILRKMQVEATNPVSYKLPIGDTELLMI